MLLALNGVSQTVQLANQVCPLVVATRRALNDKAVRSQPIRNMLFERDSSLTERLSYYIVAVEKDQYRIDNVSAPDGTFTHEKLRHSLCRSDQIPVGAWPHSRLSQNY